MGRSAARLSALVAVLAAAGVATAAPAEAARGVTVQITQLPGEFVAGGSPARVTVVADRSRGGCVKVRWSLLLRAGGARPDRVQVVRIEQDGSFPVDLERAADAIRITDQRLDPGRLCRDRNVTAQYAIAVPADAGDIAELTLAAEAYSGGGKLLDRTTVTRKVRPAQTSPDPAAGAAALAQSSVPSADPAPGAKRTGDAGVTRIGPIGLAVGAVMVLLGLGLLLRVRRGSRRLQRAGPAGHRAGRRTTQPFDRTTQPFGRITQPRGRTQPTLTLPPLRR